MHETINHAMIDTMSAVWLPSFSIKGNRTSALPQPHSGQKCNEKTFKTFMQLKTRFSDQILYSCNNINTTLIQISRLFLFWLFLQN